MSTHDEPEAVETTATRARSTWFGRASVAESSEFAGHLAALTRTGLPLPSGLRALGSELPRSRLGRVMVRTAERLEVGSPLDDAVAGLAEEFPPHLRGLMVAGARSGKLGDVLGQFVRYVSLGASLRRRFWMAVAYPVFLLVAMAMLYLFLCGWVVEGFETILKDFGLEVPAITKALFLLAHATLEQGPAILLWGSVILLVGLACFRFTMSPAVRRTILTTIPFVGPLLRYSVLAEFCHLAGLLVESEMPLREALALAGEGVDDAELAASVQALCRSVEEGRSLSDSLELWPRCPAGLREVLGGSEARGDLPAALHMAGDMFEARARGHASFASSLFAAMTVLLVIWGIGFVLMGLYLPVFRLLGKLV
jgi:general secretion pathway protein F